MELDFIRPAVVRLTLRYPFFTEIFYSMDTQEAGEDIPTAATDGRHLWLNRAFFATLNLDEQVGVLCHELGHKIFLHPTRRGRRDPELWNIACDYAINGLLKQNSIALPGPATSVADLMSGIQKQGHLFDPKYDGWLAEAIHADLLEQVKQQQQSGQGKSGKGQPQLPEGWGDIKEPQGSPEEISRAEDETKALVERAVASAKAIGKVPAGIEAGVVNAFKPTKEPWYNHLHRFMQSLALSEYNWAKVNRRALKSHGCFAPLHYSEAMGEIALFIDTSGSCFAAAEQANFASHLNAILAEAKPKRVYVYYFDTVVYPGEVIEAGELDIQTKPKGGGGTSFAPLFRRLDEDGIAPEVCIVLTDMYGDFPAAAPECAVIWADVCGQVEPPFGEHLVIEA